MKREEIRITKSTISAIKEEAEKSYPDEGCGILFADQSGKVITKIYRMDNTSDPQLKGEYFFIDPLKIYRAEQQAGEMGLKLMGFFHTHPDCEAVLSEEDKKYMIPQMLYMVLSVTEGKCRDIRAFERSAETDDVFGIRIMEADE